MATYFYGFSHYEAFEGIFLRFYSKSDQKCAPGLAIDDTADDLPDLASDKEDDLEAGETDDLKPNSWLKGDTEL